MVHARQDVRQMRDSIEDVLRCSQPIIVAPVERHWSDHILQQIHRHVTVVVRIVIRLAAPVIAVEPLWVDLLSVVEDGGGGGAGWGVVHDCLQQWFVQLRLVKAAEDEQDVGADALEVELTLQF